MKKIKVSPGKPYRSAYARGREGDMSSEVGAASHSVNPKTVVKRPIPIAVDRKLSKTKYRHLDK